MYFLKEFTHYEIPGLGFGTDVGTKGYLIFAHSRAGNDDMYRFINEKVHNCNKLILKFHSLFFNFIKILLPFVKNIKEFHGLEDQAAVMTEDGEQAQINLFQYEDVQDAFNTAKVIVLKLPRGSTSINQALDVGKLFKAIKTKLKQINDNHIYDNTLMEILKKAIAAQNKKYEGTKEKKNHLTSMKMKQIAYGICKINLASQETVKRSIIRESFELVGAVDYRKGNLMIITFY